MNWVLSMTHQKRLALCMKLSCSTPRLSSCQPSTKWSSSTRWQDLMFSLRLTLSSSWNLSTARLFLSYTIGCLIWTNTTTSDRCQQKITGGSTHYLKVVCMQSTVLHQSLWSYLLWTIFFLTVHSKDWSHGRLHCSLSAYLKCFQLCNKPLPKPGGSADNKLRKL